MPKLPDKDEPLRVAHVVFALGIGGLETGLVNLLSGLDKDRFRHHVYCMKVLGENTDAARAAGAEVTLVGELEGRNRLIIPKLASHFRRWRPHIVHSRNFGTVDAIPAAVMAGVPRRIHGEHGFDVPDLDGTDKKRKRVRTLFSPMVHRYVCVSHQLNGWLRGHRGFFGDKVETIHNGVRLERYLPVERQAPGARPFHIGTVGRLAAVKDQRSLILAFDRIAKDRADLRLSVFGDGPLRAELEATIAQCAARDRICLPGFSDQMADVYQSLDLFCLPSLNEGISNTILEAMASALPVVATNVGGNPELVVEGVTGTLVPPADVEALARVLASYADTPTTARLHGMAGRARAIEHFSLTRMISEYANLYDRIVGR